MLEKWEYTNNYMGTDYSDYYVLHTVNTCSTLLEWANFIAFLDELDCKQKKYEIAVFGHWAFGKIFSILLPEEPEFGEKMIRKVEKYPIYNESIFDELQSLLIDKILEDETDREEAYEKAYESSFEVSVYQFLYDEINNMIDKYKK